MVKAEIERNRIYLESAPSQKEQVQEIMGSRWDKGSRRWHIPLSWSACKQMRGVFGNELELGPQLLKWAQEEVSDRIAPSLTIREALELPDNGVFDPRLYPFQRAGAQFLFTARNALLSDPMGSGKTVQVIAAAKARTLLPALVICPSSMRRTWGREVQKWWPGTPTHVVEGTAAQRKKILEAASDNPGFVIINWEAVRLHSRLSGYGDIALTQEERTQKILNQIPFKLVVGDECHRMKDPRSKQTRAVWACAHNPATAYRWALTGTPLTNAPDTLWPILHFLDPNEWPGKTSFIERYCLKSYNLWGGLDVFGIRPDREEEFFQIFDPRFRRMHKEVVLPNLPPLLPPETRECDMGTKQKKAYKQMVDRMFAETEDGSLAVASSPMVQTMRMLQFASCYVESIETTIDPEGKQHNKAILSEPSCKLDSFMDDLPDMLQDEESVVVFANSRQLLRLLAARFEKRPKTQGGPIPYGIIEGGQTADVRQNHMDAFQNGKVKVILVVTAAGGTGITLTAARTAVFLQLPWSNVDYQQAVGRVHRIGSEKHSSVRIIHYLTNETIEETMMNTLDEKAQMMEDIVRDGEALRKYLEGK